jgi:hypothetical protein
MPPKGHKLFEWAAPNRRTELKSLRMGKIPPPQAYGIEPIDITNGIDWSSLNDCPPPVRWWFNNFKFSQPLFLSGEAQDVDVARQIVKSWVEANPRENPASNFAWDGHATAIRAEHVACLAQSVTANWLDAAIAEHAAFLSDPANHQGNWNHGLDQDLGLLALGFVAGRKDWVALARERTIANIAASVDHQGVTNEQAVSYQFYNFVRFLDAHTQFDQAGMPLPDDILERVLLMPSFLAHAFQPDGQWVMLGDTGEEDRRRLIGTEAEWSYTMGKSGTPPRQRFVDYHAGFIFGRTGWGTERPFEDESFYSLRYGPGRIIHGHNDHTSLTYYSRRREILRDGGFHSYTGDKWRDHLRTPWAHNTVYANDESRFRWQAPTRLLDIKVQPNWQSYRLHDQPYDRTDRERSVLFLQEPFEAIVVVDKMSGRSRRTYEQAWHFGENFKLRLDGNKVFANDGKLRIELHQFWPYDEMAVAKGQEDPIRGWGGFGKLDLRPVPVVLTRRSGAFVTYLTVIVIGGDLAVEQSPSAKGRVLRLTQEGRTAKVSIDSSNVLTVF